MNKFFPPVAILSLMVGSISQAATIEQVLKANPTFLKGNGCSFLISPSANSEQPISVSYQDQFGYLTSVFPNSTWVNSEEKNYFEIRGTDMLEEGSLKIKYDRETLKIYQAVIVDAPGGCYLN